jgi:tetratricopeptide (TPR) repeat protein
VELGPQAALNYDTLAFVLQDSDMAAALRAADRAIELDPHNADYHVRRGSLLRPAGRDPSGLHQAEAALREALRLDPESIDALYELALIHVAAGRNDAAERALRRVAASDPSRAESVRGTLRFVDRNRLSGGSTRRNARVWRRLLVVAVVAAVLRFVIGGLGERDAPSGPMSPLPTFTFETPTFRLPPPTFRLPPESMSVDLEPLFTLTQLPTPIVVPRTP